MIFRTLLTTSLIASASTGFAQRHSCDPSELIHTVELARIENVEVTRDQNLFWIDVVAAPDVTGIPPELLENGMVRASAIQVLTEGNDCSAIVDAVKVQRGDQWRNLRIAGNSVFAAGYFTDRFTAGSLQIGLDLFLLQRTYCDIKVNALIYAGSNPYLRPYPYPDPQC